MQWLINIIKKTFNRLTKHNIAVYASQATLFVIISAIPFMMLLISLLKFFVPFDKADVLDLGYAFMPGDVLPLLHNILDEVFSGATIPIVSVTTITALWAASKGMMALVQGLESVYESGAGRGYIKTRLLSLAYTAAFVIIIMATLLFFVLGGYVIKFTAVHFPVVSYVIKLVYTFPVIIYFMILTVIFALLYRMLPGKNLSLLNQFPGAAFSSCGWIIFSTAFSFYINKFTDYSYIYGSLTAVVLLMLWLYFCMNIFLLGAEINCLLKERKEKRLEG